MRFFIVAIDGEHELEYGWIYAHPRKAKETETTIELVNELMYGDQHEQAPKDVLLEISDQEYGLLLECSSLGYDSSDLIEQIITHRKGDGSDEFDFNKLQTK